MYKKRSLYFLCFTVAAILLIGSLVFFTSQPQAFASPVMQDATATPAPEEEATHDHAHEEAAAESASADSASTDSEAEPTLHDMAHQIEDLQAQIDALKSGDRGMAEASLNEVTTAVYLLDTAGFHALDVRLNEDKQIEAGDSGQVARVANLLSSVDWPHALAADAETLIALLDQLSTALSNDDLATAAPLSSQVHEAQHGFSHSIEHWMADAPSASAMHDEAGQAFRVTSAVYLLDTVGLHELSTRLSDEKDLQASDSGNVARIARLLSTVDWPDALASDAISLTTTLNDLASALSNDDLEAATELADIAHETQHDFSHAAEHWLASAMGAHEEDVHAAEESEDAHVHADEAMTDTETMTETETITGTETISDTH